MARGDAEMRIRVPDDVKEWLANQAKQNLRTQAAQVVFALRVAMSAAEGKFADRAPAADLENAA